MARTTARTSRPPLSHERIVSTAVELADDQGLTGLSMRSLARQLGVEAMSLYHHVPNKEALLDAMVDAVFAELHDPAAGGDWREELRLRSRSGREAMKRHRWAIGLMDSRSNPGPQTLHHHDAVLGCLRAAGFDLPMVGHAAALLDAHLYGFVVQEVALPFQDAAELEDLVETMLAALPEGELVHFREFALGHALQPGYSFGDEFDWGLELVLDGLAARLEGTR
jgi:AcrR family transcriptional regulator